MWKREHMDLLSLLVRGCLDYMSMVEKGMVRNKQCPVDHRGRRGETLMYLTGKGGEVFLQQRQHSVVLLAAATWERRDQGLLQWGFKEEHEQH